MVSTNGFLKDGHNRWLGWIVAAVAILTASAAISGSLLPPKAAPRVAPVTRHVTTPAQRCAALEKQFDAALLKGVPARNLVNAKRLRAEGGHLCEIGRHAAGALRLSRALADLGLKPKEP